MIRRCAIHLQCCRLRHLGCARAAGNYLGLGAPPGGSGLGPDGRRGSPASRKTTPRSDTIRLLNRNLNVSLQENVYFPAVLARIKLPDKVATDHKLLVEKLKEVILPYRPPAMPRIDRHSRLRHITSWESALPAQSMLSRGGRCRSKQRWRCSRGRGRALKNRSRASLLSWDPSPLLMRSCRRVHVTQSRSRQLFLFFTASSHLTDSLSTQ